VGPVLMQFLAPRIGVDAVVGLAMLFLLGTLPCIRGLARWAEARHGRFVLPDGDPGARIGGGILSGFKILVRSPYLLGIFAIIALGSIAAAFMYNELLRLAGELQHPGLVEPVLAALEGDRPALHREAARALAQIGGDAAVHALVNALSSDRPELPELAAHCLGVLRDPRAVQPLLAALERARRNGDGRRAREMIRAMGAVGHERAIPRLAALLERHPVIRRKQLRDLQIAALVALESIPGREARRALERAGKHRDPSVRSRANQILASARAGQTVES